MYVVRFDQETTTPRIQAYALRKAKRELDGDGHACVRQGTLLHCASCRRTATLLADERGYYLTGNLPEAQCG